MQDDAFSGVGMSGYQSGNLPGTYQTLNTAPVFQVRRVSLIDMRERHTY